MGFHQINMTKLLTITTLLLTILVSPIVASEIDGSMSCTVLGTSVTQVEEGRQIKYGKYVGGIEKGTSIYISYKFYVSDKEIHITAKNNEPKFFAFSEGKFKKRDDFLKENFPNEFLADDNKISFGRDRIFLDYIFGEITLERYYKSDWGGMIVSTSGLSTLVASLNCRSNIDKIDEIITDLDRNGY